MKTAMKLTIGILGIAVMTGGWGAAQAAAQNPDAIDNARSVANSLQQKQANDSNAALNAAGVPSTAKPAPGTTPAKPAPAQAPTSQPQANKAQTSKAQTNKSSSQPRTAKSTAGSAKAKPAVAAAKSSGAPTAAKSAKAATTKTATGKTAKAKTKTKIAANAAAAKSAKPAAKSAEAAQAAKPDDKKSDDKKDDKKDDVKWAMSGKRDPFFSPVVQQSGSSCSTGKKCLEIGNINLHGIVKSDSGFIAVVTNNLGKAYFLRENDPVFNGFVVKITGDSVVFEETVEDKLGKPFTREVVKRIFTPAV
jgi:hypothetical protein